MEFHQVLKVAGGALTLALFIPMAVEVVKRNGAGQSFSTWLLWAILDSILAASTFARHGNFLSPLGYAIGGWLLTALLVMKGRLVWGWLDTVVLALVLVCLIGWDCGGARTAIIFATLATSLATLPGFIELWRNPQRTVGNIWAGYALANCLAFAGGTAMTVEERFSPAIFAVLSLLMFAASRRDSFRS